MQVIKITPKNIQVRDLTTNAYLWLDIKQFEKPPSINDRLEYKNGLYRTKE